MRGLLILCATATLALALPAAALAANPVPPGAVTGSAKDVGLSAATLTASVDPNGSATSYHLEYGTSDSYGLQTPDKDAGSGDAAVPVEAAVTGLTSTTSYHYRVVATNAAGVTRGADHSLTTLAPPRAPGVSTGAAKGTVADTTTLVGSLDPRGADTTFHFEYGTTSKYGSVTPDQPATGTGTRVVMAPLTGLAPYTKYYFRIVATNATGSSRGSGRTVLTLRAPTGVVIDSATPNPVLWSGSVTLHGRVTGSGIAGTGLIVERQDFPFDRPAWIAKRLNAGPDGSFTTTIAPLWSTVRLRVVAQTTIKAASAPLDVASRATVGVRRSGATPTSVSLSGVVNPAAPLAVVSVQRLTSAGRWVVVQRTGVQPLSRNRSRYAITVPRPRRAALMRVVVLPNDGGAHVRAVSRELRIRGQRAAAPARTT